MSKRTRDVVVHCGPQQNFPVRDVAASLRLTVVAYVDDAADRERSAIDGVPVITFGDWHTSVRDIPSVVSALDPADRRRLAERIGRRGGAFLTPERFSTPGVSRTARLGEGALIGSAPLFVGWATTVGCHAIIATPASIGHDCVIGDFVTLQPAVTISGCVAIEDDVVIGAGAVIVNGTAAKPLRIGRGARIDVGAIVMGLVPAGAFVSGNPGRVSGSI